VCEILCAAVGYSALIDTLMMTSFWHFTGNLVLEQGVTCKSKINRGSYRRLMITSGSLLGKHVITSLK